MSRTTITSSLSAIAALILAATLWATDANAVSVDLVHDGVATASIVVAKQPTRSARLAAAELQYHVEKITGATLPIVTDDQSPTGARILVGESAATRTLYLRNDDFSPQEYLIKFLPETIVLMGRDQDDRGTFDYADVTTFPNFFHEQGTCYAVYDFLERHAQVRWYLPTELGECYPTAKTLQVSGDEVRRSPAMKYRMISHSSFPADLCGDTVTLENPPPHLPLREKHLFLLRHRLGGMPYLANHSLYGYYDRFWKEGDAQTEPAFEQFRPEYFAQGYQGKPPQMCYANPGLVRQVIQDARDYFDGKGLKHKSYAQGDYFPIVPMDNSQFCKCAKCTERILKEATRGDGHFSNDMVSNYFFAFVNEVAREVKKSHPQKYIAALAYNYFVYPPTDFKLESNVSIQLCLVARNIYCQETQQNDRAILNAWAEESVGRPKLLWLYYCFPSLVATQPFFLFSGNVPPFRCFPPFFAHTVVEQMAAYRKAGISGMYCQPSYIAHNQQSVLLDQLEFYVTWKLADDPTLDGSALIDEFFTRYYGSAAAPMKAFYELVERIYANPANYPKTFLDRVGIIYNGDIVIGNHQSEEIAWKYLGKQQRMDQLKELMQRAIAAAETDIEKQRVALFEKGIWQYMQAGRNAYLERSKGDNAQ